MPKNFEDFKQKIEKMDFYEEWKGNYESIILQKKARKKIFEIVYELLPHLKKMTTGELVAITNLHRKQVINMAKQWEKNGKAIISTTKTLGHEYLILLKEIEEEG